MDEGPGTAHGSDRGRRSGSRIGLETRRAARVRARPALFETIVVAGAGAGAVGVVETAVAVGVAEVAVAAFVAADAGHRVRAAVGRGLPAGVAAVRAQLGGEAGAQPLEHARRAVAVRAAVGVDAAVAAAAAQVGRAARARRAALA